MLKFLLLFVFSAAALVEITITKPANAPQEQSSEVVGSGPSQQGTQGTSIVANLTNTVNCMRDNGHEQSYKGDNSVSKHNFDKIKNELAHEMRHASKEESAHFLAQVFHESAGFTAFSEKAHFKPMQFAEDRDGPDAINMIIDNDEQSRKFKKSHYDASFRGRGLIQLTGCANYMAFLHYLNTNEWRTYWPLNKSTLDTLSATDKSDLLNKGGTSQLNMKCSQNTIKAFSKQYQTLFNKPLDPHSIIGDQLAFIPGTTHGAYTGEQLIVKSAMAFWRGKCLDKTIRPIVIAEKMNQEYRARISSTCQGYKDQNLCAKIEAISLCVNGGRNGLEDRVRWYKVAKECADKHF